MFTSRRFLLAVATFMGCLLLMHGPLTADAKKDKAVEAKKDKEPDKKKAEPRKPVVVTDQWLNADLKDKVYTSSHFKSYTFKMEKDKSYSIELASPNYRPVLRLENAAGNQVASDFDQFGRNLSAMIVYRSPKTEDYSIIATTPNFNNVNGRFTLTVKELTGDEGKPIELKFDKGEANYKGEIARTDARYNGKIHKQFVVTFEQGKTYQIDHMSGAFDAYLYLIGPDGGVLAQDDDGGVGLNSRIVHRAGKTGEYRIIATSLGGSSNGQFTFKIHEQR